MKKNKQQLKLERLKKEVADVKADNRLLKGIILKIKSAQQKEQDEGELKDIEKALYKA